MPKRFFQRLADWWNRPIEQRIASIIYRSYALENFLFVKRHSLDFGGNIPRTNLVAESQFSLANANPYQAYDNYDFKQLIAEGISTGVTPSSFIDIGCGKGKQCIYAQKYFHFDRIVGMDFSQALIDIARKNLERVDYKNIQFIVADAAEWKIPHGACIVFLYNPFNQVILEKFLRNNLDHFKTHPSIICYATDIRRSVVTNLGFETIYRNHRTESSIYRFTRT